MALVAVDASYKGSRGKLLVFDSRILYETFDGKKVSLSLSTILSVKEEGKDVVLECRASGKKPKTRKFTVQDASDRSKWITTLQDQLKGTPSLPTQQLSTNPTPTSLAERRASVLLSDPDLKDLYDILVTKGVLTPEQFWSKRPEHSLLSDETPFEPIGVSNSLSSELQPSEDGNELQVHMTLNMIHDIFVQNPAVHNAYKENVPLRMSEREFWEQYWRAQLLTRSSQLSEGAVKASKFFQRYTQNEQKIDPNEILDGIDPSMDLSVQEVQMEVEDEIMKPSRKVIDRITKHARYVLGSLVSDQRKEMDMRKAYHKELEESLRLEDLEGEEHQGIHKELNLKTFESLFSDSRQFVDPSTYSKAIVKGIKCISAIKGKEYIDPPIVSDAVVASAVDILKQVSLLQQSQYKAKVLHEEKGKNDVFIFDPKEGKDVRITDDLVKRISNQISKGNELLRHYWSNIPPSTSEMEQRAFTMRNALKQFEIEVVGKREKLKQTEFAFLSCLFDSSIESVQKALQMYSREDSSKRLRYAQ